MNKRFKWFALAAAICLSVSMPNAALAAPQQYNKTISGGYGYSFAVKEDGSLWAWGENSLGQLGDGTRDDRPSPVKIMDGVQSVSAGYVHVLALKTDGTLWAWGENSCGQLGDGTMVTRDKPVKVMDGVLTAAAGSGHSLAIKTDGTLWAWGDNSSGQLGIGEMGGTTQGGQHVGDVLIAVQVMEDVAALAANAEHSMAVKTDNTLWTWGDNSCGQLGLGTRTVSEDDLIVEDNNKSTPAKVMDGAAVVSASGYNSFAIKTDGTLWAWGDNMHGQLGLGTKTTIDNPCTTPEKVMDDVAAVSGTDTHTLAVKTDGTLWAFGSNDYGQLGDNTRDERLTPVNTMSAVTDATCGVFYSLALGANGSLWAWGNNEFNQLGDGTSTSWIAAVKILDGLEQPQPVISKGDAQQPPAVAPAEQTQQVQPPVAPAEPEQPAAPAQDQNDPKRLNILEFNGDTTIISNPVKNVNGRAMYPLRECLEFLGAEVDWNTDTKTVRGTIGDAFVEFTIDAESYTASGETSRMDVAPFMEDGVTYIPIRYAAEGLGFTVSFYQTADANVVVVKST